MAIASLSDLISNATAGRRYLSVFQKIAPNLAGTATVWNTMWQFKGVPNIGLYDGSDLNAVQCDDAQGGIYHGGDVSPYTKHLTKVSIMASSSQVPPGVLILYDRLLYYPGLDPSVNTSQALTNSVTLPRYTSGLGVRAWLEVTSQLGGVAGVFTYGTSGYTNSDGTTGRQHGVTVALAASQVQDRIPHSGSTVNNNTWNPFLPMQVGDKGIRSVESIRFTTAPGSGEVALVLGFPLAVMPIPSQNVYCERDLVFQVPSLPRIYDGATLAFIFCPLNATSTNAYFVGDLEFIWG